MKFPYWAECENCKESRLHIMERINGSIESFCVVCKKPVPYLIIENNNEINLVRTR